MRAGITSKYLMPRRCACSRSLDTDLRECFDMVGDKRNRHDNNVRDFLLRKRINCLNEGRLEPPLRANFALKA